MPKPGERVFALLSSDDKNVYLLGKGVYEGNFPKEMTFGGLTINRPNPRIKLDNGKTVWGCECWWGYEDEYEATVKGKKVIEWDIDDARKGILPSNKKEQLQN